MSTTQTFEGRPYRLVFFKKEGCKPCEIAADQLQQVLDLHPELGEFVTVMQKENHSALVAAFNLELYPTVLVTDIKGNEVGRKVGARFLTRDWWHAALSNIHMFRLRNNI